MKQNLVFIWISILSLVLVISCEKDETDGEPAPGILQLSMVKVGIQYLTLQGPNKDIPVDKSIDITFSSPLDTSTIRNSILLRKNATENVLFDVSYTDNNKTVVIRPHQNLNYLSAYSLLVTDNIKGANKETFAGGVEYTFTTIDGTMELSGITLNGYDFSTSSRLQDIDHKNITLVMNFSEELDPSAYMSFINLSPGVSLSYSLSSGNKQVTVTNDSELKGYTRYYLTISANLTSKAGYSFKGFSNDFYTDLDSTCKFPEITDDKLLELVQQQTFRYFYDFAHPSCGMARERNTSGDIVTTGGSGFGVMALIVGMERGFISRIEGVNRIDKILDFLESCDRYHGVWPHWLNGSTGNTVPFSALDDGGDLVETSFMVQGLLTMRQYLDSLNNTEKDIINRINTLCNGVEYDWFTRGEEVLYWHWSPNTGWAMNMKIEGYNETLITYVLAASSKSNGITADVYRTGYTRNGLIVNGNNYFGYTLPLGQAYGGPLFFTHYSFLGLDPRNLQDDLANYWEQNVNHTLINHAYCVENPGNYIGYRADSWGLTASDNPWGYSAHSPTNDLGVITPTAAISSIPYTPVQSMNAIRHFYYILGDKLWGDCGFYDAFNITEGWWADSYIAIDQGPIICMIENYRTSLLWDLFMSCHEVKDGLDRLGFTY
jgi:hypothetical protein